mmetsp:Transcript_28618/g.65810  ORF Transcript_28618/g.65810 Transcript_28618/m.65810 type:complete len:83 (-) Transcript_28618:154-402(-)
MKPSKVKPSDLKPPNLKPSKLETAETHMYAGVVYGPGVGTPTVRSAISIHVACFSLRLKMPLDLHLSAHLALLSLASGLHWH